jgi:hypothetical protein
MYQMMILASFGVFAIYNLHNPLSRKVMPIVQEMVLL